MIEQLKPLMKELSVSNFFREVFLIGGYIENLQKESFKDLDIAFRFIGSDFLRFLSHIRDSKIKEKLEIAQVYPPDNLGELYHGKVNPFGYAPFRVFLMSILEEVVPIKSFGSWYCPLGIIDATPLDEKTQPDNKGRIHIIHIFENRSYGDALVDWRDFQKQGKYKKIFPDF